MAAPSPLGTLSKLPPEIRCEIWRYFMPDEIRATEKVNRTLLLDLILGPVPLVLSVKQKSRQLFNEISDMLYNKDISFRIRVPKASTLPREVITKGLPFSSLEDLERLNFSRFNSIRFKLTLRRRQVITWSYTIRLRYSYPRYGRFVYFSARIGLVAP